MSSNTFPEPRDLHEFDYFAGDIVSLGERLTTANLMEAYGKGIFPWFIDGLPLPWFCPARRAILEFENLHIAKSLRKFRRNSNFEITIDKDFERVIRKCATTVRNRETGTWITNDFIKVYSEYHALGKAHSIEVWRKSGELVGGLYGVDANGVFCGESMFHEAPNTSKLALLHLIEHLESRGAGWLDIQVMTPHMEALGATEIDRDGFLDKLRVEQDKGLVLF